MTAARSQFLNWLGATNPRLLRDAVAFANTGSAESQLGEAGTALATAVSGATSQPSSGWAKLTDFLNNAGTAYLQYKSQRDLLKAQLDRAQKGLPPLNASQYQPGFDVDIGLSGDMMKYLLIGGGALALLLFMRN